MSPSQAEADASRDAMLETSRRKVAALELALERAAGRDALTGLPTRLRLRQGLAAEIAGARRHRRPLTVALVDLDGFRALNDRRGSVAGDGALVAVAEVIRECTRAIDVVARTAADEFALVMPDTDVPGAMLCVERMLLELKALDADAFPGLSVSIGVASFRPAQTPQELLAAAAGALDAARAAGGGRAIAVDGLTAQPSPVENWRAEAVSTLAMALLERDRYTGEHSLSVVKMAGAVAAGLGLDEAEVGRVRAAALLHDIGKVAIPDDVMDNPGALDDAQWALIREHPAIGERIVHAVAGMAGVARIVRHEHEHFDGSGYPDGLAGEEIPIGSRIILACDAYHAMTSDRPYRHAMSHAAAIDQLLDHAGPQFDPEVVDHLLGYFTRA